MDDRSPEKKYAFPNDEMIEQEKERSKQGNNKQTAPAQERQLQPPKVDLATPYETQGLETHNVPPPDYTIPSEQTPSGDTEMF